MIYVTQNESTLSFCKDGNFSVQMKGLPEGLLQHEASKFENLSYAYAMSTFQSLLEIAIREASPCIIAMQSDDILTEQWVQFQVRRALVTQFQETQSELWPTTGPTIHSSGFV